MKTVIVYSGGLDSTVLLYHLRLAGHNIHALSVDYGQRHRCELERASAICEELGIPQPVADLSALQPLLAGSSLTSGDRSRRRALHKENMKSTVVPNRNMILLSVATGHALSISGANCLRRPLW